MVTKTPQYRTGLSFKKLDLHTHTPASKCFRDRTVTPEQIVQAALAKNLDGLAITDHNSGGWIDRVKIAAEGSPLVVFPGVEITCLGGAGGIHLIALFDVSHGTREIESVLGNLGLAPDEYGKEDTIVQMDPFAVSDIIAKRGGIVVLAHANSSKGALNEMRGQQRIDLVQHRAISGAEGTDFQNLELKQKRKRVVDLLDGTEPTFKRKLAVYQASDNPSEIADGSHGLTDIGTRCSHFKMDHVNLEGLAQCLADPDVRIRQDFEFQALCCPFIKRIKVNGGFLNNSDAQFHQGLNSILGAKGAGKSLLIEFLRFGLNQPPANEDIRRDYEGKLEHRLQNYSSVEITVVDETGHEAVFARTWDPAEENPYTAGGTKDPAELFPVLFLSQNEIIKIAENEAEQIAFIDGFFDFRVFQQRIAALESELTGFDRVLGECFVAFGTQRSIEEKIEGLKKDISALDTALKNPVFDQFSNLEVKDNAMRAQLRFIDDLIQTVSRDQQQYGLIELPAIPESCAADPAAKRMHDVISAAKSRIIDKLDEAAKALNLSKQQAEAEYAKWSPEFLTAKKNYTEAVQKEGGDYKNLAQKRAKIIKQIEAEQQRLAPVKQKADQIKGTTMKRDEAIASLKNAYEAYSKERQERCAKLEVESGGRLMVRINESSNFDEFRQRLSALKKGSYIRDNEIELICTKATPGQFVRAIVRHGVFGKPESLEELAKAVGIEPQRLFTLSEFLKNEYAIEKILGLEHKALPKDQPEIKYKVADGSFQPLSQLSVGQKCTAMLILALSDGSFPIVIDQPEDSLDIRTIWEDMCTKVRKGKERRQFIFTTHNSSLAVASDTDKFTVLESGATSGRVMFSGSMDHAPVRDEVITYLEGGPDTYRRKFEKYRITTEGPS